MPGKLGHPAVDTPRSVPVDAQNTISQIRQRLEALEAAFELAATTSATSIAALKSALTIITQPATGGTTSQKFSASVPVTGFMALQVTGSNLVGPADPTVLGQSFDCIGVALGSAPAGGVVQVATAGSVVTLQNTTFTPFLPVFSGPAGALTQTPPIAPAVIQVGVALTATVILVAPGMTLLNAGTLTSTMDDFLPVTRQGASTVWQVNGLLIGVRRTVDFVNGGGITFSGTDDPANNRVIITIGITNIGGVDVAADQLCRFPDQSEEPEDEDFSFADWQFDVVIDTNLVVNIWPDEVEEPEQEDFGFIFVPPATAPNIPDFILYYFPDEAEEPEPEDFGTGGNFSVAGLEIDLIVCVFPDQPEEPDDEQFGFVQTTVGNEQDTPRYYFPDQVEEDLELPTDGVDTTENF
jgi:hypothetical protein